MGETRRVETYIRPSTDRQDDQHQRDSIHEYLDDGNLGDSSMCTTRVPRRMSMDANDGDGDMVELNVKVPERLLEEIDELAEELEYTNRSEFIREVLRGMTEPILTPGAKEGVSQGYADVAAGRTKSTDEARKRLGIDED